MSATVFFPAGVDDERRRDTAPVLVPLLEREGAARVHPRGVAIEAPPRERPIRVGEQDEFLIGEARALPP